MDGRRTSNPVSSPDSSPFQRAWIIARDNSLLMVTGAIIALVWANWSPSSYERLTGALRFPVNDVAMAFFFGLAMKEIIEATAPDGALHTFRRAALPVCRSRHASDRCHD